jgi:plasmid maintenance system killer protein
MGSLEITRILFWNSGRVTIDAKDLESFDPVRLTAVEGVDILDASTVFDNIESPSPTHFAGDVSTPDPHFSVKKVGSQWRIKFRYVEPQRGAVIQVVHTGSRELNPVGMVGSIVGASSFEKRLVTIVASLPLPVPSALERLVSYRMKRSIYVCMHLLVFVLGIVVTVFYVVLAAEDHQPLLLGGALLQAASLWLIGRNLVRLRSAVPTGLEGYLAGPL